MLLHEELLQALRLRRRDPEARRVSPELVHCEMGTVPSELIRSFVSHLRLAHQR